MCGMGGGLGLCAKGVWGVGQSVVVCGGERGARVGKEGVLGSWGVGEYWILKSCRVCGVLSVCGELDGWKEGMGSWGV